MIQTKQFTSGVIRMAEYDSASRHLELTFDNKTRLAYIQVPQWIFDRISRDPSPKAFWEDNIAQEYSKGEVKATPTDLNLKQQLNDLFRKS